MPFDLNSYFKEKIALVDENLKRGMPAQNEDPATLHESMHYSLMAPGKRIRPILVLASAATLGLGDEDVLPLAISLEMIHVFSLIHDDLPAMDDDDLRRGQPTNHKVYGDAVAILAGDALLAQAFIPLTRCNTEKFRAENILAVIKLMAEATGTAGMIGGQVIDLESEGKIINLPRLQKLHRLKTGALIRAAVLSPAILSGAGEVQTKSLTAYGEAIGLAFQIADDILDIEGGTELGKDIGSDVANGKSTYPALLGLEDAKKAAHDALNMAISSLEPFGEKADILRHIAKFIVARKK
jgi:geranylgeranyl diphosphate synthase type II